MLEKAWVNFLLGVLFMFSVAYDIGAIVTGENLSWVNIFFLLAALVGVTYFFKKGFTIIRAKK